MASRVTSAWSLRASPKRLEVALAVVVTIQVVSGLAVGEETSWVWFGTGFVASALAVGPGAASAFGRRIGAWFRAVGVGGRAVAILAFVIVVWTVSRLGAVPEVVIYSFGTGGLLAIAGVTFLRWGVSLGSRIRRFVRTVSSQLR